MLVNRPKLLAAALAGLMLLPVAPRPAQAQDLRIGLAALSGSVDPHFYNLAANLTLALHVFDRLVQRGADASLQPGLAQSWTPVSDTVWAFALRPGVTWQDGQPFTADDVAFSLARAPNVPNSPSSFAGFLRAIARVEVVDPLTVHLHTHTPAPNLPGDLANVAIVSRHAGENATTEDYNSGKAAIGTGPYRLVRFVRGDRVDLVRNPAWWGQAPEWETVSLRAIPNAGARVAALLAGDVDMIDQPPLSNVEQLRADNRVSVITTQGMRIIFLGPDVDKPSTPFAMDLAGQPLAVNPMRDRRVRQALSLGLNRAALAERLMNGAATPTGQWMPPGTPGSIADLPTPTLDMDRARRLLAEAGFPQGFRLVLHTPNDRYPNDAALSQAIAQMWTRIGVATTVEALPGSIYSPRGLRHEFAMGLWGWSNNTAEAGGGLVNILGTTDRAAGRGVSNVTGYANQAMDALTARALSTLDDAQRATLLADAVRLAMDDAAVIPLFHLVNVWVARRGLAYDARADEQSWAVGVRSRR
ncbi:ABC transporter substrate-binding protein [Humitalea sp. 24SJ18S-53]|uniref:ABC transporter substrate-binding protein n=1 Tax=Humitalea sp. 24SJ18S-53 TaxID=3422307 RepID=UPI003D6678B7